MQKYCLSQVCGQYCLGIVLVEKDKSFRVFPSLNEDELEKLKETQDIKKIGQIVAKKRIAFVSTDKEALINRTQKFFDQRNALEKLQSDLRMEELAILKDGKNTI